MKIELLAIAQTELEDALWAICCRSLFWGRLFYFIFGSSLGAFLRLIIE